VRISVYRYWGVFYLKINDFIGRILNRPNPGENEPAPELPKDPEKPVPNKAPSHPNPNKNSPVQKETREGQSGTSSGIRRPTSFSNSSPTPSQVDFNVQMIHDMFGEFGPTVSAYILTQILTPGGIIRILQKLELRTRGREGADLAQIETWLITNGVEAFCIRVGIRSKSSSTDPGLLNRHTPMESEDPRLHIRSLDDTQPMRDRPAMSSTTFNRQKQLGDKGASHQTKVTMKPTDLGKDPGEDSAPPPPPPPSMPPPKPGYGFCPKGESDTKSGTNGKDFPGR